MIIILAIYVRRVVIGSVVNIRRVVIGSCAVGCGHATTTFGGNIDAIGITKVFELLTLRAPRKKNASENVVC